MFARDDGSISVLNSSGQTVEQSEVRRDGGFHRTTFDPTNTQSWDTHTVTTDATGNVISDSYDYSTTLSSYLNGTHRLSDFRIDQLDGASVEQLLAEMEREALDGGLVGDHTPLPSAYNNDVFTSGYSVFPGGSYRMQFGVSDNNDYTLNTTIALESVLGTSGVDSSGLDDYYEDFQYDDATDGSSTWDVFDLDVLNWDPVILDLDGNGVRITPRQVSNEYFSLDSDSFKEQTAWMGYGDGMLVIDVNGDNNITR